MNVKEQLAAALKRAQELSKSAGERDLTAEELTEVKSLTDNIDGLKAQVKKADEDFALLKRLGDLGRPQAKAADEADMPALTLGEHFVKHAGERLKANRGTPGASASAPEWFGAKASTTTQDTTGSGWTPVLTEVDRTIVRGVRTRLTIADLLGSGTISGNAVSYFVEGAVEGAFTTVAEAGAKPQLHIVDPTTVTDALKKIAAFIKFTDEMTEDLDFYVSEINNRLIYLLGVFEEQQLLNGAGTGTTVTGLLNRSGIQTETGATLRRQRRRGVPRDHQGHDRLRSRRRRHRDPPDRLPGVPPEEGRQQPVLRRRLLRRRVRRRRRPDAAAAVGPAHRGHPGDRRRHGPGRRVQAGRHGVPQGRRPGRVDEQSRLGLHVQPRHDSRRGARRARVRVPAGFVKLTLGTT
jgi:hypothetical protein